MVPDAQAQPALGAQLLETGEQHVAHRRHDQKQRYQHGQRCGDQQVAAGEDVQVQRTADRQHGAMIGPRLWVSSSITSMMTTGR